MRWDLGLLSQPVADSSVSWASELLPKSYLLSAISQKSHKFKTIFKPKHKTFYPKHNLTSKFYPIFFIMKIYLVSIFPEIFDSFLETSLIAKAVQKWILEFQTVNPRNFTTDKHNQIDDEIYAGWAGMLMMAKPLIDSVNSIIQNLDDFQIIFPSPSPKFFNQIQAHSFSKSQNIIFVCARYEWVDHRFVQYFQDKYPKQFHQISIWQFITLWWELPAMTMLESIVRLIPWVIKEEASRQIESYSPSQNMKNIEYPQYTRPQEVYGYTVPDVLLSGDHKKIQDWKNQQESILPD